MNIGIITYHRAENYGSVLQAYALNKYIKNINSKFHVETLLITTMKPKKRCIIFFNQILQ